MFNNPLGPDVRLFGSSINPSDVALYLPFTQNLNDQGFYNLSYVNISGVPPVIEDGWAKFAHPKNSGAAAAAQAQTPNMVFRHPIFNTITNSNADFTIEFNLRIAGDGNSNINAARLKVFPFSIAGAAVADVYMSPPNSSTLVAPAGELLEIGMSVGSHTSPGGFGFGVGPSGTETGVAVACTTDETNPNGYVNRGFTPIPTGNSNLWGPYYFAIVRKNAIVTIFLNGKKIYSPFGADENGDGTPDSNSTWTWQTWWLNSMLGGNEYGFYVGASFGYSNYGLDDDLFLQHFRVTTNVAKYSEDFIPEPIYTV